MSTDHQSENKGNGDLYEVEGSLSPVVGGQTQSTADSSKLSSDQLTLLRGLVQSRIRKDLRMIEQHDVYNLTHEISALHTIDKALYKMLKDEINGTK